MAYLKPWRRRIGVLALLIACVFSAAWVRSYRTVEHVMFPVPPYVSSRIHAGVLCSWRQRLVLILQANDSDVRTAVVPKWQSWDSSQVSAVSIINGLDEMDKSPNMRWNLRVLGVGYGERVNPALPQDGLSTWCYVIPHAPIVFVLTVLSAWLLLIVPPATPKPILANEIE